MPGIATQFRVPENRNDQNLIAAATAAFDNSAAQDAKFIEIGMDADFRAQLTGTRDRFSAARDEWASAVEEHAGAVGELDALFREMMRLARKRDAIIKIRFKDNPKKLAAWTVASHLERAPKSDGGATPVS